MLKQIYRLMICLCLLAMCFSCVDEREKGRAQNPQEEGDRMVTLTFQAMVPGMTEATRVAGDGSVDEYINKLELYLFDHKNGFTGVATATALTHNNQYVNTATGEGGKYTTSGEYNQNKGTYTVTIPQNTTHIHFLANYDRDAEGFDIEEHIGRTETEVFGPLSTQKRIYWGRATATYDNATAQMSIGQDPIVLYRNYAKVKVKNASEGKLNIYGWTLYRQPTHATVAPYDAAKVPTYENPDLSPFVFDNLSSLKMTAPIYTYRTTQANTTQNRADALLNIDKYSASAAHWMFEYDDELYRSVAEGESNRVFAIFKIGQTPTGQTEEDVRLYKIELLKTTGTGTSAIKTPYDVVRNWEYTITFKGITPEFGEPINGDDETTALAKVIEGLPANNNEVSITKTLPEVVSSKYTLRIENEGKGSTIRYYKTDEIAAITETSTNSANETLYTVNDITVFYNGAGDDASKLKAVWEDDEQLPGAADDITVTSKGNNLFTLSFKTTNFTDDASSASHYKWGRIRVSENVEGLLSRYVKVYIGPSITFRPLLYSSDIPNLVDERLTVLFTIPSESYLPADLYPIEVRFGSDRIDVERNNEVASMKVDVATTATDVAAQDYTNVLRWRYYDETRFAWTARKEHTVANTWKYEYVYTIEEPAQSGQKRITLRTVNKNSNDFRVMMEGRSTVTGTPVFNTRELYFMMQNDGSTTFADGEWKTNTTGTEASNEYKRIMLKNGMPETRYVTAYINAMRQTGAAASSTEVDVNIEYELGTFDNGTKKATGPTKTVNIWAYYDAEKLTPKSVTAGGTTNSTFTEGINLHTDTEGNTFIRFPHGTESASGTVTFTTKNGANVENSMVFLTARFHGKYGWAHIDNTNYPYDIIEAIKQGNQSASTHSGVNYLAQSYRSAGAIINIRNNWDFDPAPSNTNTTGSYSFATSIAVDYGTGKDLYLRIDRPANTENVRLTFDTKGKFTLQENTDEYTITSTENGKYTVTLVNKSSEYCYLHFKSAVFQSGGVIDMASASGSAVPYNPATLEVTNNAISFEYFQFANETDLAGETIRYYDDSADENIHRTAHPIKGSQVGIRVYFPTTLMAQGDFRFRLSSNCFKVVDNGQSVTVDGTVTDTYSVSDYAETGDGLIIATHGSVLQQTTITRNGENVTLCYLDILLESVKKQSTESIKFLGAAGSNDFHFYPYVIGLLCGSESYEVEVMHQKDGMTGFTSKPLADVGPTEGKSIITYQIVLPNLGRVYTLPMTVNHGGYFKDVTADKTSGGETIYKYVSHDDESFRITIDTKANEERTIKFSLDLDTEIPEGASIPITFDIGGDVVDLTPNPTILKLADYLPITAQLSISTDGSNYTTLADGALFHQMPSAKNAPVYLKISLPKEINGEDLNIGFTSCTNIHYRQLRLQNDETNKNERGIYNYSYDITTSGQSDYYSYTKKDDESYEVVLKMENRTYGIAEKLTISGTSDSYKLNETTVILATPPTTTRDKYAVSLSDQSNTKEKDGNEIFAISAANAVSPSNNQLSTVFTECGNYGVKMDGDGFISFYAPEDNMYLTIISAITDGANSTGQLVVKNANNENVYTTGNAGLNGSRFVYQLSSKGLYSIRRSSGNTMGVFYLELNKSNPDAMEFGSIAWNATSTDGDVNNATWSGSIGGDNRIAVSDFAEKLTLTIGANGKEEATLLTLASDSYKIENGTIDNTITLTPSNGVFTITLLPKDGETLVDETFSISGKSAVTGSYLEYKSKSVTVYVRPYVTVSSDFNSAITVGDIVSMTISVPEKHQGKPISFKPKAGYNKEYIHLYEYPTGEGITTTLGNNPHNEEFKVSIANADAQYVYKWIARKSSTDGGPRLELRAYKDIDDTDVYVNGNFLDKNGSNGSKFSTNRYNINVYTGSFISTGDTRGYAQYRVNGASEWNYFLGTGSQTSGSVFYYSGFNEDGSVDISQAHISNYSTKTTNFASGTNIDIRITIPEAVVYSDVQFTYNGTTYTASSAVYEDGKKYAMFTNIPITVAGSFQITNTNTDGYSISNSATIKIGIGETTKTWDFATLASNAEDKTEINCSSENYININNQDCYIGEENFKGLIFANKDKFILRNGNKYLQHWRKYKGNSTLGIINLTKGCVVTVKTQGNCLDNTNLQNATLTSSDTTNNIYVFKMNSDGILPLTIIDGDYIGLLSISVINWH